MFNRKLIYLIFVFLFLLFPSKILAQVSIGKFYHLGSPDWVEIVNNTEDNINFSEYLILDVAGNRIDEEIIIPANGNCVFDYSNKLNKAGDTIFLQKSGEQIDCVKYLDGASGQCDDIKDPEVSEEKPTSNCFVPTPKPTDTPTPKPTPTAKPTSTPKPTIKPTATPRPTVILTSKPISTLSPTREPEPEILAASDEAELEPVSAIQESLESPQIATEEPKVEDNEFNIGNFLLILGGVIITGSLGWFGYSIYNEKRGKEKDQFKNIS